MKKTNRSLTNWKVDTIIVIGDKIISNLIHGTTQVPIDFPLAPELEEMNAS